ncbi:protein of unknown function [Seinonella peptonophila]|uniref:DUF1259 domain-containing protein n=1 Tax=Seinonella peptonophila TaxID=112248 RepID=A0A1M4T5D2_9BACL|nr:DUF1259 domain-containing protein [Seinonella peptonophila]SHE39733.1 protein of unknown function [Seinonella peptonophila]
MYDWNLESWRQNFYTYYGWPHHYFYRLPQNVVSSPLPAQMRVTSNQQDIKLNANKSLCKIVKEASGLPVKESKGVCQISIHREDLTVLQKGVKLPGEMLSLMLSADIAEINHIAYLTAEFALLQDEVNPVIDRVRQAGLLVSALHNHWIFEKPRILYLHFQGSGNPADLAAGVRQAVNATRFSNR